MDRLEAELDPHLEKSPYGTVPGFDGPRTRRTGSLIARSSTVRELVVNALVLGVVEKFHSHAQLMQLSLTEVIALSPGAQAQFIHRDELLLDAYPFDNSYAVYCNTILAMTDCTEEMGATRIVPGSHKLGSDVQFDVTDTAGAERPPSPAGLIFKPSPPASRADSSVVYRSSSVRCSPDTQRGPLRRKPPASRLEHRQRLATGCVAPRR